MKFPHPACEKLDPVKSPHNVKFVAEASEAIVVFSIGDAILTQPPLVGPSIEKYLSVVILPIYSEEEPTFNIPEELLTSLFKVTFDEVFVVIRELELYKTSSIFMLLHVKFNPDS